MTTDMGEPRPGSTGPSDAPDCYRITDTSRYRRGGVGVVYEAVLGEPRGDTPVGTSVALKMLTGIDETRFGKLQERSAALREVRHQGLARHVECFLGLPPVDFAIDERPDLFYSANAWVEGRPLSELLDTATSDQILRWAGELAAAIDYLHHADGGFAHRDIHARNVIITPDQRAVLIDYDTILWRDVEDTFVLNTSSPRPSARGAGLPGAQETDRSMLAMLILAGLARSAERVGTEQLHTEAVQNLRSVSANADQAVATLVRSIGKPPTTCQILVDDLRADIVGKRRRRRAPLAIGAAAAVAAVVAGVLLLLPDQHAAAAKQERTYAETVGGPSNTWSDYVHAGGTGGAEILSQQTVQISCVIPGFVVQDGNKSWYRIASSPWNDRFYVSADAFYNGVKPGGSLKGTPFVDPKVPACTG